MGKRIALVVVGIETKTEETRVDINRSSTRRTTRSKRESKRVERDQEEGEGRCRWLDGLFVVGWLAAQCCLLARLLAHLPTLPVGCPTPACRV